MWMKPFKPPLLRKPGGSSTNIHTSTNCDADSKQKPGSSANIGRQSSKVDENFEGESRQQNEHSGRIEERRSTTAALGTSSAAAKFTPPLRAKNNSDNAESNGEAFQEGYYTVLWRKFTAKKHKTWDGDGVLSVLGGYAILQDVSGRDLGKVQWNAPLLPGSTLSISGKDVEVDTIITKQDYLAGRPFLNNKKPTMIVEPPKPIVVPSPRLNISKEESTPNPKTRAVPRSAGVAGQFKNPLLEKTVLPKQAGDDPVPRHDPNQPGALVMMRPPNAPKGQRIVDVIVDPLLTKHLREHQREGVKFLYECVMGLREFDGQGAILADEMGLGKTLQTVALLWTLLKQNPFYDAPPVVKKALIVCPVTLINNWKREFRKWLGNERIGVFVADNTKTRLTDFTLGKSYSIMIIGYEKLRTVQEDLKKGHNIDIVIADEGHRLKTAQNKSAQAIDSLNTSRRVILSGTPIQNDLSEFFTMVNFVNPNVLGKYTTFRREFEAPILKSRQPGASKKDVEKGEARSEELVTTTSTFILRRTAEILSKYLPPKTEHVLFCRPTKAQASVYRSLLSSPMFGSILGNAEASLQLINVLKKACNSPSLLKDKKVQDASGSETDNSLMTSLLNCIPSGLLSSPAASGKLQVLDSFLYTLHSKTQEKVVIVSNYTSTLDLIGMLLTSLSYSFVRLDGSTPSSKRQDIVDTFNRTPPSVCFAFLLSAKSGGAGLNLIGASRLVLFDADWNPATDLQAMARIHRDGQKRPCRIYRLLTRGALDEKIYQRQLTKQGLADSVMDNKATASSFTREELRDLFTLDETSSCQTHDLLDCWCEGRGGSTASEAGPSPSSTDDSHAASPQKSSTSEVADSDPDESLEDEEPQANDHANSEDYLFQPTLLKASQVNMDLQERRIRSTQRLAQINAKRSKMEALMQYAHIDVSKCSLPVTLPDPVPHSGTGTVTDSPPSPSSSSTPSSRTLLQSLIDDDVLYDILSEEGNRISFVFKRTSMAPPLTTSMAEQAANDAVAKAAK
ncbi:DNA repair and recombination protein RAD26 [Xylona heveae TC161]|uniref:DNA repair and recombination protein RAD26 n=1 Tax=Xylona heveae (strain CBS 132557 / TC161) TaxID=1328760 RepID=A0A165HXU8_XYLHT|nr:DNA repair and recombination protein RAD26 [Xylona heveae TC161]KZF24078.1 DNA repair and recombination protein RAD26 [Xylona heveae TC161]